MLSNTSEVPMLAGGFITLDMVMKPPNTKERRTKIICTIGPASWSEENLGKLMVRVICCVRRCWTIRRASNFEPTIPYEMFAGRWNGKRATREFNITTKRFLSNESLFCRQNIAR